MYMYHGRKKVLKLTILRVRNVGFVRTRHAPRRVKGRKLASLSTALLCSKREQCDL